MKTIQKRILPFLLSLAALLPIHAGANDGVFTSQYGLSYSALEGKWGFSGTTTHIFLEVDGNRISGVVPQQGIRASGTISREPNGDLKAALRWVGRGGHTGCYSFHMNSFDAHGPHSFRSVMTFDKTGEVYRHLVRRSGN